MARKTRPHISTTFRIPLDLLPHIEEIQKRNGLPSRSDTMLALIRIGIETETKKAKRRTPRPIEDQELAS